MPGQLKCRVIVLWEHEVRAAAKAVYALTDDVALRDATPTEVHALMSTALSACLLALRGANDDKAALTLGSAPDLVARFGRDIGGDAPTAEVK